MTAARDRRAILETVHGAVGREVHNLASWPGMTWQQLHNRLQWEDVADQVLTAEAARRETTDAPWARVKTAYPESSALVRTLSGHDFWAMDCAVSPNGDLLATATNAAVIVWDLVTGAVRFRLDAGGACAFGPDGSILAAGVNGADDGMLAVFDAGTGERLRTSMETKGQAVSRCVVSPDGSFIVTGHHSPYFTSGDLIVWDTLTLEPLLIDLEESLNLSPVEACAVTPDGRRLLLADGHGGLRILDARTGEPIWARTGDELAVGKVRAGAVSPDGRLVAVGGNAGRSVLLDAETGRDVVGLAGDGATINACAIAPDGALVACGREDGTVELWDVSGAPRGALVGHAKGVLCCSFTPDGALLVTGGRDLTAKIWDPARVTEEAGRSGGHDAAVQSCVAAPDGTVFLSAGEEGLLGMWDVDGGQLLRVVPQPAGRKGDPPVVPGRPHYVLEGGARYLGGFPLPRLSDCSVSPDASIAFCVGMNKDLKTWDLRTGDQLQTWQGHEYPIYGCAVSPDGRFLVSAAADRTARIWEAASGQEIQILEASENLRDCAVSPDGTFVVAVGSGGSVQLWDPETGERTRSMAVSSAGLVRTPGVNACAVGPDGTFVITAAEHGVVAVWDPQAGAARTSFRLHDGDATDCAVTPDGVLAASAGVDQTIRFWRVADEAQVLTVAVPGTPQALALHPWRPVMAWGDSAGSVFVADLVGLRLGPIVVTPVRQGRVEVATCPACRSSIPVVAGDGAARCSGCGLEVRFSGNVRAELRWDGRRARRALRRARKHREPLESHGSVDTLQDRLTSWAGDERR